MSLWFNNHDISQSAHLEQLRTRVRDHGLSLLHVKISQTYISSNIFSHLYGMRIALIIQVGGLFFHIMFFDQDSASRHVYPV